MSIWRKLFGVLRSLLALILLGQIYPAAVAAEVLPGPITATVIDVIDGDSLRLRVRIWLDQEVTVVLRLSGIDAPELRSRCATEHRVAEKARALTAFLVTGQTVTLTNITRDKYGGRVVGDVRLSDGRDLATILATANLARSYDGGTRGGWCG
jgi:micrococcal nuclease